MNPPRRVHAKPTHRQPACPRCSQPCLTLTGNVALCRNKECCWQGRSYDVSYVARRTA